MGIHYNERYPFSPPCRIVSPVLWLRCRINQDGYIVRILVSSHQIRQSVSVEVADDNPLRERSHPEVLRSVERPIPIAEQNGYVAGPLIRYRQVEEGIAVEVAYRDRTRASSSPIIDRRLKRAVPISEQDGDGV